MEVYNDIVAWHMQIGSIEGSTNLIQSAKLMEEWGEVHKAIIQKDRDEILDGIGDTGVVLIGMIERSNIDMLFNQAVIDVIDNHVDKVFPEVEVDLAIATRYVSNINLQTLNDDMKIMDVLELVACLSKLAERYGSTFEECLQLAYGVISKRTLTGRWIDGYFVKEENLPENQ